MTDGTWTPTYRPLPVEVVDAVGLYAYALVDPRPNVEGPLFYIGRGRGSRLLAHVWAALIDAGLPVASTAQDKSDIAHEVAAAKQEITTEKVTRIQAIHDAGGLSVRHVPLGWFGDAVDPAGNVSAEAVCGRAESIAINTAVLAATGDPNAALADAHLTNRVRGADSQMADLAEVIEMYAAEPTRPLGENLAAVVINKKYRRDMTRAELMDALRREWQAGAEARTNPDLVILALAGNIVRAVVRPTQWRPIKGKPRWWEFTPVPDPELEALYVDTRLEPAAVGRPRWTRHGWTPRVSHLDA